MATQTDFKTFLNYLKYLFEEQVLPIAQKRNPKYKRGETSANALANFLSSLEDLISAMRVDSPPVGDANRIDEKNHNPIFFIKVILDKGNKAMTAELMNEKETLNMVLKGKIQ